jgi:hypothetical protein
MYFETLAFELRKTILDRGNNPGALLRIVSSIETPAFQCGTCSMYFETLAFELRKQSWTGEIILAPCSGLFPLRKQGNNPEQGKR